MFIIPVQTGELAGTIVNPNGWGQFFYYDTSLHYIITEGGVVASTISDSVVANDPQLGGAYGAVVLDSNNSVLYHQTGYGVNATILRAILVHQPYWARLVAFLITLASPFSLTE